MRHRQKLLVAGAVGALVLGGLATATLPASAATSGCAVTYTVQSEWSGGFSADLAVTNLGDAMSDWTLTFDFPNADQQVTQGWSAAWTQSGSGVSASSLGWNGSLGTSASTSIGFVGAWLDANPEPASFALNGTPCTGSTESPTTTPTDDPTTTPPDGPAPQLSVSGNQIVTEDGEPYR
ncbi:cellulose binding domain-containing protein, partial [Glycomyces paridis]